LRLTCSVAPAVPARGIGSADRIDQILVNLIGNAIKFTERGEIAVRVQPAPEKAGHILFSVRDTGIGIPAGKRNLLFQTFSQVDASRTRKYGGTGLGLAICKGLVTLMGGRIDVESEEGKGSTFFFELPLRPEKASLPKTVPARTAVSSGQRLRILLAEDDPLISQLVVGILRQHNWDVVTACEGEEAVQAWASGGIDLILMDIQMPRMDGLEATGRIRDMEKAAGTHVPILALTAHARREDAELCRQAGMDDFISKPITRERLYAKVEAALGAHMRR
jgi:CheY-like chemotaxis protein/anti-sigma regulatory factor (Ser/Thr protein kinase)